MKLGIVWLDSHSSNIYNFIDGQMNISHLKVEESEHHNSNPHDDLKKQKKMEKLFSQIHHEVAEKEYLIVVGPGTAKNQFQHYCEKHYPEQFVKKIQSVESCDGHFNEKNAKQRAEEFYNHHFSFAKL